MEADIPFSLSMDLEICFLIPRVYPRFIEADNSVIEKSASGSNLMKTLIASALIASFTLASTGAQAADTKTRAEVVSELAQAKASGAYTFGDLAYPAPAAQDTQLTRQDVEAALQVAQGDGEVTFGNLDYPPTNVNAAPTRAVSRAQVEAQLQEAKSSGHYTFGNLDYPPRNG
jgi:hypothetical protein